MPRERNTYRSQYPFMPLNQILDFEKDMQDQKVSKVSRSRGFLKRYKEVQGDKDKMGYVQNISYTQKWVHRRESFIKRHLAQVIKKNEPLYDTQGQPTRRTLAFYAWAFDPSPRQTRKARLKRR